MAASMQNASIQNKLQLNMNSESPPLKPPTALTDSQVSDDRIKDVWLDNFF